MEVSSCQFRIGLLKLLCLTLLLHVQCTSQSNVCQTGQVRLAGGSSYLQGRVEYCRNGDWGTVCDDDFGLPDAEVTCKQLGFSGTGTMVRDKAFFGEGQGGIFLERLDCTGNESGLKQCSLLNTQCIHSEDVGVICQSNAMANSGVSLYYKGRLVSNNSLIPVEALEENDPLYCVTTQLSCCNTSSTGNWYPPTGTSPLTSGLGSQNPLYQTRGDDQSIRLHATNTSVSVMGGLYSCVLPDSDNNSRTLYVGIYSSPTEGSVSTVTLAYDEASATLTCTSAGGPATSVSWTKDGAPVEVDGVSYQQTQIVLNTATATYENRLTIAQRESRLSGLYRCTVENSRGSMASQEVQVTVCRDGEVRILETSLTQRQLELCSANTWVQVESTLQVRTSENVVQNLIAKTTISGVELNWNADDSSISSYDVSCSNSKNTFVLHLNTEAQSASFTSLPSSSDYRCCVTAHLNRKLANTATYFDRECSQAVSTGGVVLQPTNLTQGSYLTYSLIGLIVVLIVCVISVALGCVCVLISKRNYQKTHPRRNTLDINTASSFLVDNPIYKTTGSVASLDSENGILSNGNNHRDKPFTPKKMDSFHQSSVPQPNGHLPMESKQALASNPQYGTVEQHLDQQSRYVKVASDSEPAYEFLPDTHQSSSRSRVPFVGGPDPIYSTPTALNHHPSHQGPRPEYKLPVYESTTDIPATSGKDGDYAKLNHCT